MPKFRKKPVVIEARQWTGENADDILDWINEGYDGMAYLKPNGVDLVIPTLEGNHTASMYDWIIRGVQSEFYPCKPDIFDATYEPAP